MTYPAPDVLPYDEWFDSNYEYNPMERLHDDMRKAYENPRPEEDIADDITMHEKMYKLATKNGSTIGGSENNE
mgnify:CR=1 FL=1|tara:strand:- start:232 stop:450 length:219 start_codon:yes stop_codon:yes gene_type:complete